MRHSWLALAVVAAIAGVLVGTADAKRITYSCRSQLVRPERGAMDLPINTKIWVLGAFGAVHQTADGILLPALVEAHRQAVPRNVIK